MDLVPELLAAARAGSVLDCGSAEVDAADLRRACLTEGIDPYGLRLTRARITGPLDLRAATVRVPLWFDGCEFTDPVVVEGASLHELVITNSTLPGLLGDSVRISTNLDLSGTTIRADLPSTASRHVTSAVWLMDAEIGGRLLAAGTRIHATQGRALVCSRAHIRGEVRLTYGFEAFGTIRLLTARIDGYLDVVGATLTAPSGPALDLNEATLGGSVFLLDAFATNTPTIIRGRIEMGRATIGGQLLMRNVELHASPPEREPGNSLSEQTTGRPALLAPHLVVHGQCAIRGGAVIDGGIYLQGSDLRSGIQFDGADVRNPGETAVDLSNAVLNAGLHLGAAAIRGTVNMRNARVAGVVTLAGTTLTDPWQRWSLRAAGLRAEGDVGLSKVQARGGLDFRGATIAGMLNAEDAEIINPSGETLGIQSAHVQGNVRICGEFRSVGELVLTRATVGGRLRADGASLAWATDPGMPWSNPLSLAVNAASTSFHGGMDLGWRVEAGGVDLSHATTTYLFDRPESDWPENTWLGGFTYERFVADADAPSRIAWLSRLRPNEPRAWEQVARVLRAGGDHTGADEVLIAQRRHARHHPAVPQGLLRRAFDALQDRTVRYGFRPERVVGLLLTLVAAVTISLSIPGWAATMRASDQNAVVYKPTDGCGDGKVRCLSPFFYAVDTVVPIIDLKQRDTWYPGPGRGGTAMEWWLNICTVLGWIASTIFALSFTRLGRGSD